MEQYYKLQMISGEEVMFLYNLEKRISPDKVMHDELTNSGFDLNSFRILGIFTKPSSINGSDPENITLTSHQSMTSKSKRKEKFLKILERKSGKMIISSIK